MAIDANDAFEIYQLLANYCHALDQKRWDDFAPMFTSDAVFDMSSFGGGRFEGRTAIHAFYSSFPDHSHAHVTCSTYLEPEGDQVRATSKWFIARHGYLPGGVYRDLLSKHEGPWRFRERFVTHEWTVPVAPASVMQPPSQ